MRTSTRFGVGVRCSALVAFGSVLAFGCSTKKPTLQACLDMHSAGDFSAAAKAVATVEDNDGGSAWFLMQRGKIEQDGGMFSESMQSYDAAASTIASSFGGTAYAPTLSDAVMLRQGMIVNALLAGDATRAAFASDGLAKAYQAFVGGGAEIVDEIEFSEIDTDHERIARVALMAESAAADRVLLGTWFPAWLACMASGRTDQAALALRSLGWGLEDVDLDLASAMIERTAAGSLGDDIYVLFESGLAPMLEPLEVELELPAGERLEVELPLVAPRTADRGTRVVAVDGGAMFDTQPVGSVEAAMVLEYASGLRYQWNAAVRRAAGDLAMQVAEAAERAEAEALAAAEAAARKAEAEAAAAAEAAARKAEAAAAAKAEAAEHADHEAAEAGEEEEDGASADEQADVVAQESDDDDAEADDDDHGLVVAHEEGGAVMVFTTDTSADASEGDGAAVYTLVEAEAVEAEPLVGHSGPADLRSWTALPAWQQAAILARPTAGRLTLIVDAGGGFEGGRTTVEIPSGPVFLFIRSTASGNIVAYARTIAAMAPAAEESSESPDESADDPTHEMAESAEG